ncbi:DUF2793 domain-containing protein [Sphingomonas fennica]|uniref:DUF2793 domain-containing protein n=1 Tax=Edaphosphingomonas fennica TaxID=114404 RepID=A0A2T4HMG5_9SPHN|nr:DUF2793 domain-containing protein [Sphingomonas fennica]PTD16979.1 hypothetical protein CV103_18250 [Sphingomonas fennica]
MADSTARFALPNLQPGQAQKELFHNEALARIDGLLHPVVEALDQNGPPAVPEPGKAWIAGPMPTGEWAGHAGDLAIRTEGGWRFIRPVAGMTAWLTPASAWVWHDGNGWRATPAPTFGVAVGGEQVVGGRQPAIARPAGGATVDQQARTALDAILSALEAHGLIAN